MKITTHQNRRRSPILRIRKVSGSNLGQKTDYPDWVSFVIFLSPSI